ncbi:MAG TPA: AMIN domain-containing protein [Desulfobacterales bacterium]|nr:AMIN domain-containing protein [Desulfobacterales bacterium]
MLPVAPKFLSLLILVLVSVSHPRVATGYQTERDYRHALLNFEELLKDRQKQKLRHHWTACIKQFRSVYIAQPNGARADDALFMTARLYAELYGFSGNKKDKQRALDYYKRLLERFPGTRYASKTKRAIAKLSRAQARASTSSATVPVKKPLFYKKRYKAQSGALAEVIEIRFWSSPSYTRVVIDVESEVAYTHHLLKEDPTNAKPMRLCIDLNHARIGYGLKPRVPIADDLLSGVRAAQYNPETVRLVLDIKSIDDFKVFSLRNPFRIVVDVSSVPMTVASKTPSKKRFKHELEKPGGKVPKGALAKQLALGVRRIVIDPGHGGKDPGAIGHLKCVREKNVTLEISRRLAKKIRQRLGCEAILTRNTDTFLSLEERTAIANTKDADLFVSIHTNASEKKACRGIETYFLNLATDEDAILVAARENATSANNISDLQTILSDLMKNAKIDESSRLAGHVQEALIRRLKPIYSHVKDMGVKQAPFYVLLGAEMPCILIEAAFITNPRECRRLNTAGYQEDIADAVVTGIQHYIGEIHPAALIHFETGMPGG